MHINHQYLLHKATQLAQHPETVILDYGCGRGDVVEEGRRRGLCIYGAEIFYDEGTTTKADVEEKNLLGNSIKEIQHGNIPFPDRYFDLVMSNQVFEHVKDLESVLREIHRVLKPNGWMLSLFPSKDVIWEKHCGIPYLHWFSKSSRIRFYYALAFRKLGFGYHKGNKTASQWARDFIQWLDDFTCYRERKTIYQSFQKYFTISCIEADYISFRLHTTPHSQLVKTLFELSFLQPVLCKLFRRLGGLVILSQKKPCL